MVAKEKIPSWLGFWWVHIPLAGLALLLMAWQSGWRPLRRLRAAS